MDEHPIAAPAPDPIDLALAEHQIAYALTLSVHNAVAFVQSTLTLATAATVATLELVLSDPSAQGAAMIGIDATRGAVNDSFDHLKAVTAHALGVIAQIRAAAPGAAPLAAAATAPDQA